MSVNYGNRDPNKQKLQVHTKGEELANYTIKICANENIFLPKYESLIDDIRSCAVEGFINNWNANDIRVQCADDYHRRWQLQKEAIEKYDRLLALMQIAKRTFHLKSKRITYWGGLTKDVRTLTQAWRESDAKRYKSYTV